MPPIGTLEDNRHEKVTWRHRGRVDTGSGGLRRCGLLVGLSSGALVPGCLGARHEQSRHQAQHDPLPARAVFVANRNPRPVHAAGSARSEPDGPLLHDPAGGLSRSAAAGGSGCAGSADAMGRRGGARHAGPEQQRLDPRTGQVVWRPRANGGHFTSRFRRRQRYLHHRTAAESRTSGRRSAKPEVFRAARPVSGCPS